MESKQISKLQPHWRRTLQLNASGPLAAHKVHRHHHYDHHDDYRWWPLTAHPDRCYGSTPCYFCAARTVDVACIFAQHFQVFIAVFAFSASTFCHCNAVVTAGALSLSLFICHSSGSLAVFILFLIFLCCCFSVF